MEWDDGDDNTLVTPSFMFLKSQIAKGALNNFTASAINFGEYDQEDVYFEVDITKNNKSVFKQSTEPKFLYTLDIDTAHIADPYAPLDYGHYKVRYKYGQNGSDNTPENNMKETFFNITDSLYSRADALDSGIYFYSITAGTYREKKRMIIR